MAGANSRKGEVAFETKDGSEYIAVFDIDAICTLEDLVDRPALRIVGQIVAGRVGFVRAALWSGLRRHHPELTIEQVGEMMSDIEGAGAVDIVLKGIERAFPKAKPKEEGESGSPNPRTAPSEAGTGTPS